MPTPTSLMKREKSSCRWSTVGQVCGRSRTNSWSNSTPSLLLCSASVSTTKSLLAITILLTNTAIFLWLSPTTLNNLNSPMTTPKASKFSSFMGSKTPLKIAQIYPNNLMKKSTEVFNSFILSAQSEPYSNKPFRKVSSIRLSTAVGKCQDSNFLWETLAILFPTPTELLPAIPSRWHASSTLQEPRRSWR